MPARGKGRVSRLSLVFQKGDGTSPFIPAVPQKRLEGVACAFFDTLCRPDGRLFLSFSPLAKCGTSCIFWRIITLFPTSCSIKYYPVHRFALFRRQAASFPGVFRLSFPPFFPLLCGFDSHPLTPSDTGNIPQSKEWEFMQIHCISTHNLSGEWLLSPLCFCTITVSYTHLRAHET